MIHFFILRKEKTVPQLVLEDSAESRGNKEFYRVVVGFFLGEQPVKPGFANGNIHDAFRSVTVANG